MENILELAIDKFNTKNRITDKEYKLSMHEFILTIYLNCDPASYGKQFSNKLVYDLKKRFKKDIDCVSDSLDRGDLCINYFPKNVLEEKDNNIESKYYEIKMSYLGKTKNYTIRNLRPYQQLDGYLFTFVDCENSFKEEYYLISSDDLYNNCGFRFTSMNGTKKRNEKNQEVGLGVSFKKGSVIHENIKRLNILKGNDLESLFEYFNRVNQELKKEYWKNNKKTSTTVLKFEVDGYEFYENTTVKNYLNFINYVYVKKGPEVLSNVLHSFYFSSEPIDCQQVYVMDGKFFINTYCSTKHKKRNIEMICESLGMELNYYDTKNINSDKIEKLDDLVSRFKPLFMNEKDSSYNVCFKNLCEFLWEKFVFEFDYGFKTYEDFKRYFYKEYKEERSVEESMKYFENIGNYIQKLVLRAVGYEVDPYRIQDHSNYYRQVVNYVWLFIDMDENTPYKKDFLKFMKRDFADQILIHHMGLRR